MRELTEKEQEIFERILAEEHIRLEEVKKMAKTVEHKILTKKTYNVLELEALTETVKDILSRAKNGESVYAIAGDYGVTDVTIRKVLKENE